MKLDQEYDRDDLINFLKNDFLPNFTKDIRPINQGSNTKTINGAIYLGECPDLDLQVFELETSGKSEKKISQALDSFRLLREYQSYRALVAYYSKDDSNWRFALLQMTPDLSDKGKVVNKYSNPRRYSFLLGPHAKIRTPEKYLIKDGQVKDFEDLQRRFSVEVVNKDFYSSIAKLYQKFISSDSTVHLPSRENGDSVVKEFAVRLIGRLVFCWFLKQKQGPDGQLIPESILSSSAVNEDNYYHSKIEPLFFEALNKPVESRLEKYQSNGWQLIPYLNGGLFNAQEEDFYQLDSFGISTSVNSLKIPDEYFVEFIQVLELYNFTIDENTLIDQELSVDPEMLGRIFENLLAEINPETGESARKATGSFYTPREIVDFMVDQSLVQHLKEITKIPEQKLEALVSEDLEDDKRNPLTREEIVLIVDSLNNLKIIDPACGSGAFPIGILQRVLTMLQNIDPDGHLWFDRKIANIPDQMMKNLIKERFEDEKLDYVRKLGIIKDSIFGVDIQPIAVEVAKLRCFLTLVVEETVDDEKPNRGIETLPNLDFKFVCANTLVSPPDSRNGGMNFDESFQAEMAVAVDSYFQPRSIAEKFNALNKLHELVDRKADEKTKTAMSYLGTYQNEKFDREFTKAKSNAINSSITDANLWKSYKNIFKHKAVDFFDTKYFFPSVKDGFDIVIGNPPYIQLQDSKKIPKEMQTLYGTQGFQTFSKTGDIYCLFYEKGMNLLSNNGILTFITSNKWMRAGYGEKLRQFFSALNPTVLIDLGPGIFESATVDTNILVLNKSTNINHLRALVLRKDEAKNITESLNDRGSVLPNLNSSVWFIGSNTELALKKKIEGVGVPLKDWNTKINFGIKTGLNEAFTIDQLTRDRLIDEDPKSEEILKPILRGRDIDRYDYRWANLYLIATFPIHKLDINDYPAIKNYLIDFGRDRLEQAGQKLADGTSSRKKTSNEWFETQDPIAYFGEFKKEKVVWKRIGSILRFAYDKQGFLCQDSTCIMTGDNLKYLCAYMNSAIGRKLLFDKAPKTGTGDLIVSVQALDPLLIPPITQENLPTVAEIEALTDQILNQKKSDKDCYTSSLERKIDLLFYGLYDLTPEEIKIIEESVE